MISARRSGGGVTFDGVLPEGTTAFVDADWVLGEDAGTTPAIFADAQGLRWQDAPAARAANPQAEAAASLEAVALGVRRVLEGIPSGLVEVDGRGVIAQRVRSHIGAGAVPSRGNRPAACVVATPGSDALAAAARRVADLGMIVLLGEAVGGTAAIDLYPEVHLRSLTLVGVAPPLTDGPSAAPGGGAELPLPLHAVLGRTAAEAAWYRVTTSDRN